MTAPRLTTTFTPPTSCIQDIYRATRGCPGTGTNTCQYTWLQLGPTRSTNVCLPSGWASGSTAGYFSPGICPSGYTTACSSVVTIDSLSETRATCCPSGYTCQIQTDQVWYSTNLCTSVPSPFSTDIFLYTYRADDGSSCTSATGSISGTGGVNAYGVSIRWQATDSGHSTGDNIQATTTTATSTSTTSSILGTTASSSAAPSSTPANSPPTVTTRLSTEAKAGIGVGAAVASLLIFALVALLIRAKRRNRPSLPPGQVGGDGNLQEPKITRNELPVRDGTTAELAVPQTDRPELLSSSPTLVKADLPPQVAEI
ncbi:hypothetical protein ASPZODRAFT_128884 [Penicilliopsis zonata CBS 506.65]|uniref:Uncharacterized protein n=1 Tax=Penicilliopsis zonata CBS 506.65 TaxID=1073090 RepID=A0A1L9SSZ2_9EURO|nr:hypothetical protein ASPZODRAFT_128884 [Penicilliopsis zonata CBS 506.65]OJJ50256.1 hypothetical protein ASPZODRAFT_128884 [Penicilliopsis zonata CBS 506.65]